MAKLLIIRVVSSISETNAPYNQFTLYRYRYCKNIRQVLIVCSKKIPDTLSIPEDLDVHFINKSINEIYREVATEVDKARERHEKVVIHLHHPDSAGLFLLRAMLGKPDMRRITLYNVHNSFTAYPLKVKMLVSLCILLARKVCVVSKSAYATYPSLIRQIKGKNMLPIQNGFDDSRVMDHFDAAVERKRRELIYVARMAPQKNHPFLIDLIQKLPDCRLVLVGAEDKERSIRELVKERNLENRVEFTGVITRDQVFKRLNRAGLYVTPSLIEGLPVSLLEAACSALVCIASDIPSHIEVSEKVNSVKTIKLDVDLWVDTIMKQLADSNETERLGILGQKQVIDHFSLKHMNDQYDEVYKSLVGEYEC